MRGFDSSYGLPFILVGPFIVINTHFPHPRHHHHHNHHPVGTNESNRSGTEAGGRNPQVPGQIEAPSVSSKTFRGCWLITSQVPAINLSPDRRPLGIDGVEAARHGRLDQARPKPEPEPTTTDDRRLLTCLRAARGNNPPVCLRPGESRSRERKKNDIK